MANSVHSGYRRRRRRIRASMLLEPGTFIALALLILTWGGFAVLMLHASGKATHLASWLTRSI